MMHIKFPFIKKSVLFNYLSFEVYDNNKVFYTIYNKLKSKYPNYPDYILIRAAKTGYGWLNSIVKSLPKKSKEAIIKRQMNKAVEISEEWLKRWTEEMYE